MDASIYRLIWTQRRLFVAVTSLVFLCAAIVILTLPRYYKIESSIEIASAVVGGHTQLVEAADQVAKRTTERYFPAALLKLESEGLSALDISKLQSLKADASGPEIILSSTSTSGEEGNYERLHKIIANQIIESHAALSRGTQELLAINNSSAKRSAGDLEQALKANDEGLANLKERVASQVNQLSSLQDELRRSIGAVSDGRNSFSVEAQIREVRERIASAETMIRDGDQAIARLYRDQSELNRLREEQLKTIASSDLDLSLFTPSRITFGPSIIPDPVGGRKALLLISALMSSLVFALIIVIIVDRTRAEAEKVVTPPQRDRPWGELVERRL